VTASAPQPVAVRMTAVSKNFGGNRALDGVDLEIRAGEVHALLGGNGAGKSTILKILNGVYVPDGGRIEVGGVPLTEHSPDASKRVGITMIFQEMSLIPTLSVAQNIFLTHEIRDGMGLIDDAAAERQARALFVELGVDIDPKSLVESLSAGQQQLTEIVKATSRKAKVLILDEPSTALSNNDVERLFAFIKELKSQGVAIVYVSHRMDEIFRIADVITILRDGKRVVTGPVADFTMHSVVEHIVGKGSSQASGFHGIARHHNQRAEALVELRDVSGARKPRNINLTLYRGEVVGVAGLLGSGRSALARVICGIDPIVSGEMRVAGKVVKIRNPRDAIANKIALIPEDRRRQGFVADHSLADNICLPVLDSFSRFSWIKADSARQLADELIKRLRVKTESANNAVNTLSGGNAQKVVIAKWLATEPELLVLDEPTAGIDIGSKAEIVTLIRDLARQGKAVLIVASELVELLVASDRIIIMSDGMLVQDLPRAALDAGAEHIADPTDRLQLAEQALQLAIQTRGTP
jgi:ribose transport system ATP-binding protein